MLPVITSIPSGITTHETVFGFHWYGCPVVVFSRNHDPLADGAPVMLVTCGIAAVQFCPCATAQTVKMAIDRNIFFISLEATRPVFCRPPKS